MECKDPWIIYQDGRFHMYYICQKLVEPVDEPMKQTHTGINVATSTDLVHWEDHGAVVEDRWITNPMFGPWGFEAPRAVQHDGKIYMFAMYFYGLRYTVGDDPFHFGPWHVVGPWHAPVIFNDDEDRWYITHAYRPFGKPSTRGSKAGPFKGLYIAGLEWSEGVPVPVNLRAVMEDWPWQREGGRQPPPLAAAAPIGVRVGRVSPVRPRDLDVTFPLDAAAAARRSASAMRSAKRASQMYDLGQEYPLSGDEGRIRQDLILANDYNAPPPPCPRKWVSSVVRRMRRR